ncbi:MAG: YHYH protein [Bacteroidetes bacterium]|nr:YHYH protein [Bacteroidota bacterium]
MKLLLAALIFSIAVESRSQVTPEIYSWRQNTNGATGYNGIPADVQQVFYSGNYVYVKCTGIPSYTIGPWTMNPNVPTNQNWTFRITRNPVSSPNPVSAGNGQIGVLVNGVVLYNSGDAMSYNNQNIWHRIAQYFEAVSFDTSGGHPAPGGVYHYHINMKKLYSPDQNQHSPLLGYMFDGFPLYGPYAYSNSNGTGGIRRMKSGYRKRNITVRTTLPNGTVLPPNQYGPAVSSQYPLGCFVEDYELNTSGTDLDSFNGRFSVTPEYPNGIYSYFIAVDSIGNPEYPYIIGPKFYGTVTAGNTPPGGHNTISETVIQFVITTSDDIKVIPEGYYNSVSDRLNSRDTVTAYLRNVNSPFSVADSSKALIDSVSFTGHFIFSRAGTGNYYIQIKHRNSVETWSRHGGESFVNGANLNYDFTASDTKAYGNNLKLKGSRYCIFSGDVTRDGFVDVSDLSLIDNDADNFASGYVRTDVTGDLFTDLDDLSVTDNNALNFISVIRP